MDDQNDKEKVTRIAQALLVSTTNPDAPPAEGLHPVRVFAWTKRLLGSLHRARLSTIFLRRFPSPRKYEQFGITRMSWLEYHYAFYTIAISGSVDLALILTNAVYELGNEDRNCRWHIIVKDKRLPEKVVQALKSLDAVVRRTRDLRDQRVHRGRLINFADLFDEETAGGIQLMDSISYTFRTHGLATEWLGELEPRINKGFEQISRGLVEQVEAEMREINERIADLFDSLLLKY